jgi:hypothetical protein
MLGTKRRRKIVAITLIVIGILFLLTANSILLEWGDVWPLFPVIAGILLLRVYAGGKSPELLFGGVTSLFLGIFLFLFSAGPFEWDQMSSLWPFIPTIFAVALLAVAVTSRQGVSSLIAGVGILLFAALGFLYNTGVIEERVASPFIHYWPLVLIVAGIVLFKVGGKEEAGKAEDADMKAVRDVLSGESPPSPGDEEPSDNKIEP